MLPSACDSATETPERSLVCLPPGAARSALSWGGNQAANMRHALWNHPKQEARPAASLQISRLGLQTQHLPLLIYKHQGKWLLSHCCWGMSYKPTLPFPLTGSEASGVLASPSMAPSTHVQLCARLLCLHRIPGAVASHSPPQAAEHLCSDLPSWRGRL